MSGVLLFGGSGQLGRALQAEMAMVAPPRTEVDIRWPERALDRYDPNWVINAAASHYALAAELDPTEDFLVNAAAPRILAAECTKRGMRFLHLSTNYVYGGDRREGPFTEFDLPAPTTAYGVSKWAGERLVLDENPRHLVVRTSALFGPDRKDGFPGKYVLYGSTPLRVVDDQWITPTHAGDLARAIHRLIEFEAPGGIYHLSGYGPPVTWAEYAGLVLERSGHRRPLIAVTTEEYAEGVPRPKHSSLLNTRAAELGITMPYWPDALLEHLCSRS